MIRRFINQLKYVLFLIAISYSYATAYGQDDFYNINTVREIRITFKEHNWDTKLDSLFELGTDDRLLGDVTIDGHPFNNVGIRYKGYSSWSASQIKNPFYIKLDESVKYANYEGFSKLKLSNVTHDPSFIREALSYEIAQKYMPAGRANFANVYVNDTLIGLYTNVEAVDDNFTQLHFNSKGNSFIKGSPVPLVYPYGENANLNYHGLDSSNYVHYYELQSTYGWNDLVHFIDVLNNDTSNLSSVLNVDRTLWMHAFDYSLVNLDSYIGYSQNYYLYKDDNNRFNPILWDLNMSFGSFRNSDAAATNLTIQKIKQLNPLQLLTTASFTPRPLIKNLIANTMYRKMYLAHLRTIINENFKNNEYYTLGKQYQTIIDEYVQSDTNKFYSYSDFLANMDTTTGPLSNQNPGIKDLMVARMAYLDTLPGYNGAPSILQIAYSPISPVKGGEVWITAKTINSNLNLLGFRQKSTDIFVRTPMFDDGNHHDGAAGDGEYGASITITGNTVQFYIYTENDTAGMFYPERAENNYITIQPKINPGDIVINEFTKDWIEIFNNTNETYNVKDLYMADTRTDITQWALPNITIPSKTFLMIGTNQSSTVGSVSSNINIDDNGGELVLAYDDGTIVDSIAYNEMELPKSIGRYPNGIGQFVYMQPTFDKINQIGTTKNTDLLLFPNPTRDVVYIEFKNDGAPYTIEIINTNGQTLINNYYDNDYDNMSVTSKSIDISTFANGIYFIKLLYKDYVLTKKIILF